MQGQPAASVEGANTAVFEQNPELGTNERVMSWRGQDFRVWQAWNKVSIGAGGALTRCCRSFSVALNISEPEFSMSSV